MDKKIAGLLGAAAALTTITAAHAATPAQTTQPVTSYRDLLNPVADPVAALKADDARVAQKTDATADETKVAQVFYHHHHHHVIIRPFRRHWRHHHHHHHHHHY
jgi:hypothetical protein